METERFSIHLCMPSAYGRGTVLNTLVKAPVYDTRQYGEVSELDSVCVWDQEHETTDDLCSE